MRNITRRKALALMAGAAAGCAGLAGCSSEQPAASTQSSTQTEVAVNKVTLCKTDDALLGFAADTSAALLPQANANLCYSPLSLYLDFALVGLGATGTTQKEALAALRCSDANALGEYCDDTVDDLQEDYLTESTSLAIATSMWANEKTPLQPDFAKKALDALDAETYEVQMGTEEANQAMTQWVADHTEDLLKPKFDTDASTVLHLLNTVYIKPRWENPFDAEQNVKEDFTAPSGTVQTEYMCKRVEDGYYAKGEGYAACMLPFRIDYSKLDDDADEELWDLNACAMTFVLPDEGVAPADLLSSSDAALQLLNAKHDTLANINWKVPKLSFDCEFSLIEVLKSLGVEAAFVGSSDFDQMVQTQGTPVQIDSVRQGTHLTVDEEGAEAAAYTDIGMEATGLPPQDVEELDFFLTRPFLFSLTAGAKVLFTGIVLDPSQA